MLLWEWLAQCLLSLLFSQPATLPPTHPDQGQPPSPPNPLFLSNGCSASLGWAADGLFFSPVPSSSSYPQCQEGPNVLASPMLLPWLNFLGMAVEACIGLQGLSRSQAGLQPILPGSWAWTDLPWGQPFEQPPAAVGSPSTHGLVSSGFPTWVVAGQGSAQLSPCPCHCHGFHRCPVSPGARLGRAEAGVGTEEGFDFRQYNDIHC